MRAVFESALADGRLRFEARPADAASIEARRARLAGTDLKAREAAGMVFENGPDCLETYAAFSFQDLIAVPLPPAIPEDERLRLWRLLGCRWYCDKDGVHRLDDQEGATLWPDDVEWVMHSSGSTGIPKAIPLTFEAVRRNAEDVMDLLALGPKLIHLGSMSQCYTNGLFNSFLLPLLTGGSCVSGPVASALRLREFLELIRAERPDILWVNPTVVAMLQRFAKPEDLASVKALISCTAPLGRSECLAAEAAFGKPVLQSFGTTETLIVSVEAPGRSAAASFSAGKIVGGPDAVGIDGESVLNIHNRAVTPGYARLVGGRLELSLPNGGIPGELFISGDLARVTGNGNLEIFGRTTNVINVDGVKVSAEQLEDVLRSDPRVVESAVIRMCGRDGRERPLGFVQVAAPVDKHGLMELCAARLGAKARLADLHVLEAIPRTGTGKVDRVALARKYCP